MSDSADQNATDAANDTRYEPDRGAAIVVLGLTFAFSTLLAIVFGTQYTRVMLYVKNTLDAPDAAQVWEERALSPDECVDAALEWTAECRGIKTMCDAYVDGVIALCMASQPREEYCEAVATLATTTRFGFDACALRGVRRHVNSEACSGAYRAIDSYCDNLRETARL